MVVAVEARARFDDLVSNRAFELDGLVEELSSSVVTEVPELVSRAERAASEGLFVAGFVGYDAAPGFDPMLQVRTGETTPLPLAWFGVFSTSREVEVVTAPRQHLSGAWSPLGDAGEHRLAVERIKEQIRAGWTYQVNFTERFSQVIDVDPFELYRQLAVAQRGAYNTFLATPEWAVASASPECFFEMADGVVTTVPMKGTARRGRFPAEDQVAADTLTHSTKERAENLMIVDLVRNDLGRVASYGSVVVSDLFKLERYPTVWQVTSRVSARLGTGVGLVEVFRALFPCGSVTGAPKASTMRIIAELEQSPRGLYCGAIGSVLPSEHGPVARFAVAIRTATVDRLSGVATYGAGGGITFDSDAAAEWAEVGAKTEVLTYDPGDFGLFETLRYEASVGYVNGPRHLKRMSDSANFLGIPFDPNRAEQLFAGDRESMPGLARVRLSLSRSGELTFEAEALLEDAPEPLRLVIDKVAVDSREMRLFHKTTARALYDEARARYPEADDVILVNEADEVTETSRANLAVLIDGEWCTPALGCGLLPGIERGRLVEEGQLVERVITRSMCERATALATLSSLRGWRDAVLVSA
jgi:para-aminobenzoate synthetase / 4-amino-4-deoxychorismate lyase